MKKRKEENNKYSLAKTIGLVFGILLLPVVIIIVLANKNDKKSGKDE